MAQLTPLHIMRDMTRSIERMCCARFPDVSHIEALDQIAEAYVQSWEASIWYDHEDKGKLRQHWECERAKQSWWLDRRHQSQQA